MRLRLLTIVVVVGVLWGMTSAAQSNPTATAIDSYVQPFVQSGNFSGVVLVEKNGRIIFEKSYGFSDRQHSIQNTPETRFHIASMSMQFTAAAILRLVEEGAIRLEDRVAEFVPGIEGADKITIRDLLMERSGLPDINALPDYNDVLEHHQTAASLVAKIQGKPLLFEPGTKFMHEEHSAYNVLALIVEKNSGLPFAMAVERLVFQPFGLTQSGVDDDSKTLDGKMARGYQPLGTYGLEPAPAIHWSGKTGNASVFTTARDEALWVRKLFGGQVLSAASREAVLDTSVKVGYGWMKAKNERFRGTAYYMNGRAPGFASFVLYLPKAETTVVVLSNIYSSATTTMGYDVAAGSLGLPFERLRMPKHRPSVEQLNRCTGSFEFGPDFYQPNATVTVTVQGQELLLSWPSGGASPLIPMGRDRFLDRSYWEEVSIERGALGKPIALVYAHFRGILSTPTYP